MFTDRSRALILVKSFRPMFTRVPNKNGGIGPDRIALEVDELKVHGSLGESVWGHPVDVIKDRDIAEWCKGLADPHGGG